MAKNGNEEYKKMYLYLYEKEGEKSAQKFIDSIQDEINNYGGKLKAEEFLKNLDENPDKATEYINNYLAEISKGTNDGIFNWFGNVKNTIDSLFNNNDAYVYSMHEYETMYILQALKEKDYGIADENVYEISQSIGNMVPSILISSATGCPTLGAVSMGIPAGGGAAHQGLVEGYSRGQAITYGVLTGVSETCLERFLGGITGIGDVNVTSFKTLLQSMSKEAMEESTQSYLDSAFRTGIFKEDYDFVGTSKDAFKSGVYGAISGGIINSAMAGINYGINKDSNINDTETRINEDVTNILNDNVLTTMIQGAETVATIGAEVTENVNNQKIKDTTSELNKFINDNGLIDVKLLPLSEHEDVRIVQEKILNNEPLSLSERLKVRDSAVTTLDNIELYSDHMYRATSYNALLDYINSNAIRDNGQGKGYSDVNWYLGGTAKRYGKVIIETPANPNLFQLSDDYGGFLSGNPNVRQAHSSNENPVSFNEVTRIIFLDETGEKVLKVVEPNNSPNLMKEVELGNLLYEQDKLLKIKDKLGERFDNERQQQLDEINKKIENMLEIKNENLNIKNMEISNESSINNSQNTETYLGKDELDITKIQSTPNDKLEQLLWNKNTNIKSYGEIVSKLTTSQLKYAIKNDLIQDIPNYIKVGEYNISSTKLIDIIKDKNYNDLFLNHFEENSLYFENATKDAYAIAIRKLQNVQAQYRYKIFDTEDVKRCNFIYDNYKVSNLEAEDVTNNSIKEIQDTLQNSVKDKFSNLFLKYIRNDRINEAFEKINFYNKLYWYEIGRINAVGSYFSLLDSSIVLLRGSINTISSAIHESIHFIARDTLNYVTGIALNEKLNGFNEVLTEYINKTRFEEYEHSTGYDDGVIEWKQIVKIIDDLDIDFIEKCYFNHDVESLKKVIDNFAGKPIFEERILPAFNKVISSDYNERRTGIKELQKIEVELNNIRQRNRRKQRWKSIFSGK